MNFNVLSRFDTEFSRRAKDLIREKLGRRRRQSAQYFLRGAADSGEKAGLGAPKR
jgi:hypothetical protein